jgi:uncharacterized protein YbjQ (UPF0145 family)
MKLSFAESHQRVTGLSGNEIFCLSRLKMQPGQLCVGNSVIALGIARGIGAGLSTLAGGEVSEITRLVHEGRQRAFNRMMQEAKQFGGLGLTGVSFDLVTHGGNLEFITTASTVHRQDEAGHSLAFSTSANAQQLYCQVDAGFQPVHFVFGNVAYSIGIGGGVGGTFRQLVRGEVSQYTEIFSKTRHLALQRITDHAKEVGANSVIGIQTTIAPLMGAQEMMMVGTASNHPLLTQYSTNPVTSDMTNEELWNMVHLGYMPLQLVMGVSVYSLGFTGGVMAALKSLGGGEIAGLTEILYEAREKALARIEQDAEACGADQVIGVKTRVYDLGGGLVEFMAIGTAVKKFSGAKTKNPDLPPQAIIQDRETFVDVTLGGELNIGSSSAASSRRLQAAPMALVGILFLIVFFAFKVIAHL